jgi:surfactin synthase thioesterase subunit
MTDPIIAAFGFIGIAFGVIAALRIALRASLVARLLIEALFVPAGPPAPAVDVEADDARAFDLRLAA